MKVTSFHHELPKVFLSPQLIAHLHIYFASCTAIQNAFNYDVTRIYPMGQYATNSQGNVNSRGAMSNTSLCCKLQMQLQQEVYIMQYLNLIQFQSVSYKARLDCRAFHGFLCYFQDYPFNKKGLKQSRQRDSTPCCFLSYTILKYVHILSNLLRGNQSSLPQRY